MGRGVLIAMIPANLVLLLWVWFGRIAFGVGGWFLLILVPVVIVLGTGLLITTILAFTQPGRPRAVTTAQGWAQLTTWLGMLGFGLFLPDFGDTEDSVRSLLTQVFGYSSALIDASTIVAGGFGLVAVVGYLVLFGTLVGARRTG